MAVAGIMSLLRVLDVRVQVVVGFVDIGDVVVEDVEAEMVRRVNGR